MKPIPSNEDYLLTLYEVCEILGKSSRTVSRYVRKHILHPRGVKSRQGTLEYRFSKAEVYEFKKREETMGLFYYDQEPVQGQTPVASFANYEFPAPKTQPTFLIPGVSYAGQPEPSSPAAPAAPQGSGASGAVVAATTDPADPDEVTGSDRLPEKTIEKIKSNFFEPAKAEEMKNRSDEEIISLLKETTGMLRDQLKVKDDQIKNLDDKVGQLIERNRETNILLKGLQDKIMLLEKPKQASRERVQPRDSDRNTASERDEDAPVASQASSVPPESNNISPVKIKIFSNQENADPASSNTGIPEPSAYTPRPTKTSIGDLEEKKGFFGKLFG